MPTVETVSGSARKWHEEGHRQELGQAQKSKIEFAAGHVEDLLAYHRYLANDRKP